MILRRPIRDQRGISSIEFSLVVLVFFMMIFGLFDFSRAMWEWNAAAKATHWGVRYAVVNDMVAIKLANFSGILEGVAAGTSVSVGTVTTKFGTDTFTCTSTTGCNSQMDTTTDFDDIAFGLIVARMQLIYGKIQPENVIVEYRHIGFGFSGDPTSPDLHPLVTVRLTGMQFDFITPGLAGLFPINMPAFTATMTGEDLTSL